MLKYFDNEDDFLEYAPGCLNAVEKFVENLSDTYKWYFSCAYPNHKSPETYNVVFTSYDLPEYQNFKLNVRAILKVDVYECSVANRITDLT